MAAFVAVESVIVATVAPSTSAVGTVLLWKRFSLWHHTGSEEAEECFNLTFAVANANEMRFPPTSLAKATHHTRVSLELQGCKASILSLSLSRVSPDITLTENQPHVSLLWRRGDLDGRGSSAFILPLWLVMCMVRLSYKWSMVNDDNLF